MTEKVKIIISDTHIGAGGAKMGNKLEDFTSDVIFFQWVQRLIQESDQTGKEMTLIINGDWIEFLQTPTVANFDPTRRYPTEEYTDLSEAASLRRLEVVHAGHPLIFQALADFINPGPPRRDLVILFGNHDPELVYPGVQKRILELLEAQGKRKELVRIGERYYFEDGVWVEHGNAFAESVNRFTNPDAPFDPEHPEIIERPPGSYVVTDYFNKIEWDRPWIDGVHPMSSLIFYALAYDPLFAIQALKAFLEAAPDLFADILATAPADGGEQAPALAQLQEMEDQELAQRLQKDPTFAAAFADDVAMALARKGAAPAPVRGLATGPATSKAPQIRAKEIAEHYWQVLESAADEIARNTGAKVVAFGHIHERVQRRLTSGALYLNTGTWIWKMNFKHASDEVWRDLIAHPEKYIHQRFLTYARIDLSDKGAIQSARLLLADAPSAPPEPPEPMPPAGLWARFVLGMRKIIAIVTGWL